MVTPVLFGESRNREMATGPAFYFSGILCRDSELCEEKQRLKC